MNRLSYCTNVHPVEDLPGLLDQLDRYSVGVREKLDLQRLGVGLWLPAQVAAGLAADRAERVRLKAELDARGLDVFTLNAFPYGGFHDSVVKHRVYRPRWTEPARLAYTADCAAVLADLVADDAEEAGISTLPLGWRLPWSDADDAAAEAALHALTGSLRDATARAGKPIRLAVEPEPGCVLDTVAEAVRWLAPRVDPEFVGLCLDTCHLAVSFADPAKTVAAIHEAGLRVVKLQASAAVHVPDPADPAARARIAEFAEPRYLHQVRELTRSGEVLAADDLDEALQALPARGPWRVHFHVPLHTEPEGPLRSTSHVIREVLAALPPDPAVEVETYTWSVLPPQLGQNLVDGIAAELSWAATEIAGAEVIS